VKTLKALVIDPKLAGISGDMLLAALIDLTNRASEVLQLATLIEEELDYCKKLEIEIADTRKAGIRAKKIKVKLIEDKEGRKALKVKEDAIRIGKKIGLSANSMAFILRVLDDLIEAEARVHGVPINLAHFHELASADTLLDVIGVALILGKEGILGEKVEIYTTPPAIGGGFIESNHGILPCPPPATLEILRKHKYQYSQTPIEAELTTPTGIALLVNLTNNIVDFYPPMRVERVGYGAGSRDLGKIPNILRVVEGRKFKFAKDKVVVLETIIDDTTGEVLGHLIEKLMENGALDVTIIPGIGKKNRPVNVVKVISSLENYSNLVDILMKETGTLGVRVLETPRAIALRKIEKVKVEIKGRKYEVRIKVSKSADGEIINIKPEYEDVKAIASEAGIPLRKVLNYVEKQISKNALL